MSCSSSNTPIDISKSAIAGTCELKCDYKFNYPTSSCVVTHRGEYLSIAYDTSHVPPVQYNTNAYSVSNVRIYTPSIHTFNGKKADGEIIAMHTSNTGANPLLVCVPIRVDNGASNSAELLATIVDAVRTDAPTEDERVVVKVSDFSLNEFVPQKAFYTYTGAEPFLPCSGSKMDFIVFGDAASFCGIQSITLTSLRDLLTSHKYTSKTDDDGPKLFYNARGAGETSDDSIYIDCRPVGESDEMVNTSAKTQSTTETVFTVDSMKLFFKNTTVQIVLGILGFVALIYIVNMLFVSLQPDDVSGGIQGGNIIRAIRLGSGLRKV